MGKLKPGERKHAGYTQGCTHPSTVRPFTNPQRIYIRALTNLFGKQLQSVLLTLVSLRSIRNDYEINYDTRNYNRIECQYGYIR